MMRIVTAVIAILGLALAGCSTSARFIIPENTELVVHGKKATPGELGTTIQLRPLFWSSLSGIDYQLIRKDTVVQSGKLPSRFRIASIFWPPYALIYWPVGFRYSCYDLTQTVIVECDRPMQPVQDVNTD
ncbi:MAG: hypothetical protein A2X56_01830 [Nitrospirae bacterium GWC2_57_13]|jgi:hypothetical protein|nr:MAG: hypothetical protein A2X56_01830 [Nitrospirae bacterium GWC2_57_13]OGW44733.1 MAG: hypothetical protein A2X57_12690 [Nitrospirae bacterium GWD2_57_8]